MNINTETPLPHPIQISAFGFTAMIVPAVGGGLLSLMFEGRPVLRPAVAKAAHPLDIGPLDLACFPMVPYCNRIRDGRFRFGTHTVELPLNFAPERHSLHGTGWQSPWQIIKHDSDFLLLGYDTSGGDWPWAYAARLSYKILVTGLIIELSLTNRSREDMPFGLGLHPYFNRTADTHITAKTEGVWLSDEANMPTQHKPNQVPLFSYLDHCHTGFSGPLEIWGKDRPSVIMTASENCPCLHVYAPEGQAYFCAEPTTHAPDSFNRAIPTQDILGPDMTASIWMKIEVPSESNDA